MLADHDEIERRLPHAGKMCLLHQVVSVSDTEISCRAISHRDPDNPLRVGTGLPATAALEYAVQAMALHASWSARDNGPRQGVLVASRDFEMLVTRLDKAGEFIDVAAQQLGVVDNGFMYSFVLRDDERILARGKATIMYTGVRND